MTNDNQRIILGSRSPRRLELLRLIVPEQRIDVVPPESAEEPDFSGVHDWPAIECRLSEVATVKCNDVLRHVDPDGFAAVIAADTVIVASDDDGRLVVLGQPPDGEGWESVVREWFERYLLGKDHVAASGLCVATADGRRRECIVKTRVRFDASAQCWLDWYLRTGEPRGKAGGYGIQGAGGLFVSEIDGSLSNVVGLPLRELLGILEELGIVDR
jgi:nucleoside triphosphate pyrophosphatase